ncbi:MAG: division/cell wall cluster transcriptional repressor MraZ [Eubacterium sp.]
MDNYTSGADIYSYGSKVHKIDSKNRIAIPASMRSFLGQEFIITKGFGEYISLMPIYEWTAYLTKIRNSKLPTTRKEYITRKVSSSAEKTSLDAQGRVVLSEKLQKYANILGDGQAQILGNVNHIEIWKAVDEEDDINLGDLMDEVDASYDSEYERLGLG